MPQYSIANPLPGPTRDLDKFEEPIELVCTACRAAGEYRVGTLFFDPELIKSIFGPGRRWKNGKMVQDFDGLTSFTGYVVCRACGAGGPWHYPEKTRLRLRFLLVEGAFAQPGEPRPYQVAVPALFDGTPMRSANDAERHLLSLIEKSPNVAFLWNRLGNIYEKAELPNEAIPAFLKAVELDPNDAESVHSLGQLYAEGGDRDRAVEFYHRFLTVAPTAHFHNPNVKRIAMEATLETLLRWSAETKGAIKAFPPPKRDSVDGSADEPPQVALLEFDTSTREGIDRLVDFFLTPPGERKKFIQSRPFQSTYPAQDPNRLAKATSQSRNSPCPCGSGKKFKRCCGKR
jgi:hypothetical protein